MIHAPNPLAASPIPCRPTRLLAAPVAVALMLGLGPVVCFARVDACKLISAAEASRLLGSRVRVEHMDTSVAGPGAASMCRYDTGRMRDGFMLLVGRVRYANAAKEVVRQEHEEMTGIPPGIPKPTFADVGGLGDAAYLYKTPDDFQLHVLTHGNAIVVSRLVPANAKAVAQAKRIAQAALAGLAR